MDIKIKRRVADRYEHTQWIILQKYGGNIYECSKYGNVKQLKYLIHVDRWSFKATPTKFIFFCPVLLSAALLIFIIIPATSFCWDS